MVRRNENGRWNETCTLAMALSAYSKLPASSDSSHAAHSKEHEATNLEPPPARKRGGEIRLLIEVAAGAAI